MADRSGDPDELVRRVGGAEERLVSLEQHREHQWVLERDLIADIAGLIADIAGLRETLTRVEGALRARPASDSVDRLLTVAGPRGALMGYDALGGPGASSYADFEAVFRGDRAEIARRQGWYADLVADHEPVIDVGCGRGELLEVLRDRGVAGSGWDLDPGMVREAHDAGLDVTEGDLFDALGGLADGSVGTVFSAQVVEHLPPADMPRLFSEAHRVLDPRGLAVVETVNPHSVEAFRFFWLDTTHTIPVYPESALMMVRAAGFAAAVVVFPGGTGVLADDLASCGDFAVVCAKDPRTLVEVGLVSG